LDEILDNIRRVENTVRSLLLFARRWQANLQKVDISQIVDDARRTVTLDPQYPHCAMEVTVPSDVTILADPQLIGQVLTNLLGNAAQAAQPAGIVRVSAVVEEGQVYLLVDDNG